MSFKVALLWGVCLVAALHLSSGERARYDNYRVYKVNANDEAKLRTLKSMEGASDSLLFLEEVHSMGQSLHIIVAPHKVPDFLEILDINKITYELVEKNWQRVLDTDDRQVSTRSADYGWTSYHQLNDTYQWLQSLTYDFPAIVTLIEGGKSYQGRSILGVKISFSKGLVTKPGIFLEAGIHAREWIAPATATYIINQLLTSNDTGIREIAENYDWYIIPHANPDGYVYTHTSDRMWRKTRTPYGNCFGADPNRNWDFHWNEIGASNNPCTDTYAGPAAFSEIEVRSLANYIATLKGKIQLYISFHAYSQYLLYPYGATATLPENVEDYKKVFDVAIAAISKRYGKKYTGGNIYDAIYPAAGSSLDWVYEKVGAKMSFCYELRPSPNAFLTGFRLPAEQIIPTGEETLDSISAMISEVDRLGYFNTV